MSKLRKMLTVLMVAGCFAAVRAESTVLGTFKDNPDQWLLTLGSEFPGAQAQMMVSRKDDLPCLVVKYDFTGGGNYVGVTKNFKDGLNISKLTAKVFSTDGKLGIRLTDSGNQVHLHYFMVPVNQWTDLSLDAFGSTERKPNYFHWGGANDGEFRQPVKSITIMVNKDGRFPSTGELVIRSAEGSGE